MPSGAQADFIANIPPPSWSYFRDGFENVSSVRSPAWRQVGVWAVDRLSKRLGDDWPRRTYEKHGQLPGGVALAIGHPAAYFEFVELALWLEVLCEREGFADVLRPLKQDPRQDVVPHVRLELEVGALAAAAGYGVRFERPIADSKKTSDVTIDLNNEESLLVEARVVLQDDRAVAINRFTDLAFPGIQNICSQYKVECSGDLTEVLDDSKLAELLDSIEAHARLVKIGGVTPRLLLHGTQLQVSRRGSNADKGLHGPELTGDLWPRIADRLDQKARQTEGAQNVWLRICALQGLWLFTQWASLPLADKLATMRQNLLSQLSNHPHVEGVVISSASGWPQGTIEPDEYEDELGGYALRCAIPPMMARETLIVPLHPEPESTRHAHVWRDLYASEPDWLDYALAKLDLPTVAEIFTTSGESDG
jgi:hypothetical protein